MTTDPGGVFSFGSLTTIVRDKKYRRNLYVLSGAGRFGDNIDGGASYGYNPGRELA
jgi:hypothetical protein